MSHKLPDIDIDVANRNDALRHFAYIPAAIHRDSGNVVHNTGVYFSAIPTNAIDGCASLDHREAEKRGYFKVDLLNVSLYEHIKSEGHLQRLIDKEPNWKRLHTDRKFCEKIIHVGRHFRLVRDMKPDSIPRMAMLLAIIRPAKSHLQYKSWKEIGQTVWEKDEDGQYGFKKAHAVSYAMLVAVNMNLIEELENEQSTT